MDNLFASIPDAAAEELFETLLQRPGLRIERILSFGQSSPPGFWYEQASAEWVLLIQGSAELHFDGEQIPRQLKAGDYVFIPSMVRHRVTQTSTNPPAIWLAIHFDDAPDA